MPATETNHQKVEQKGGDRPKPHETEIVEKILLGRSKGAQYLMSHNRQNASLEGSEITDLAAGES